EFSWAADVQFFGANNGLIGSIILSGNGDDSKFAAWQADRGVISRLRVVYPRMDLNRIVIDDVIQEVPEPSTMACTALVVATFLPIRRCRAAHSHLFLQDSMRERRR